MATSIGLNCGAGDSFSTKYTRNLGTHKHAEATANRNSTINARFSTKLLKQKTRNLEAILRHPPPAPRFPTRSYSGGIIQRLGSSTSKPGTRWARKLLRNRSSTALKDRPSHRHRLPIISPHIKQIPRKCDGAGSPPTNRIETCLSLFGLIFFHSEEKETPEHPMIRLQSEARVSYGSR